MKNRIIRFMEFLLQMLFPGRCPVCDGIVVPWGERICLECMKKMRLITPPWCMRCGKKLKEPSEYCEDCKMRRHFFIRGRALYEYAGIEESIYRFKYGGRREYANFFGGEAVYWLGDFIDQIKPDALIPIPLHRKKQNIRGYNQAELFAERIGKLTGVPVETRILRRIRNTKPLKLQNLTERQNNLKKAFIIAKNEVKLKRVILIDDIYTTGSTMDEAAKTLSEAGVEEIYFITIACGTGI